MTSLAQQEAAKALESLDSEIRLWSRKDLAAAARVHPDTVGKALSSADSALRYTHERGRRRFVAHAVAAAWAKTLSTPVELEARFARPGRRVGLYSRRDLAVLSSCSVPTVARALAAKELSYDERIGERGFFSHAAARAWVDSFRIQG